jgi:hypothetical protein
VGTDRALRLEIADLHDQSLESYTESLGLALDHALPEKSVLLLALDRNRACCFEKQNLMFWSGRMAYPRNLEQRARERGYHPYLIASSAQPYARVADVAAASPLQAFDLDAPLPGPAPLPAGLLGASVEALGVRLLGYDVVAGDAEADRYVFYLSSENPQSPVELVFEGPTVRERRYLGPELSLEGARQLKGSAWYSLPLLGPKRAAVKGMTFGGEDVPPP